MDRPTYGLIGRGRLATHLARYFQLEKLPYRQWHRNDPEPLRVIIEGCDVLLLAIRDDAIEPFVTANPEVVDRPVVHFSGSLVAYGSNATTGEAGAVLMRESGDLLPPSAPIDVAAVGASDPPFPGIEGAGEGPAPLLVDDGIGIDGGGLRFHRSEAWPEEYERDRDACGEDYGD